MQTLTLRLATAADIPCLQQLFTESIEGSCTNEYSPEQIRVWSQTAGKQKRWEDAVANQHFLAAFCGESLSGFGALRLPNYIDFLYVHPNFQGLGVAQALMEALETEALKHGAEMLSSDVSKTAQPFFLRFGFELRHENHLERDGVSISNNHMVKDLKSA